MIILLIIIFSFGVIKPVLYLRSRVIFIDIFIESRDLWEHIFVELLKRYCVTVVCLMNLIHTFLYMLFDSNVQTFYVEEK